MSMSESTGTRICTPDDWLREDRLAWVKDMARELVVADVRSGCGCQFDDLLEAADWFVSMAEAVWDRAEQGDPDDE